MNIKRFRKADAFVGMLLMAFAAILAVFLYLNAKSSTDATANTMKGATTGLDTMVDRLKDSNGTTT